MGGVRRNAKAAELPVILLEDVAALIDLSLAPVRRQHDLATDNGTWDAAGTALVGALLVTVAMVLSIEMKPRILGEASTADQVMAIPAALEGDEDAAVERVIHVRTLRQAREAASAPSLNWSGG